MIIWQCFIVQWHLRDAHQANTSQQLPIGFGACVREVAALKKEWLEGMGSSGFSIDALMSPRSLASYCWPGAPVKLRRSVAMPTHPAVLFSFVSLARDGKDLRAHPSQPLII
jgi:hypothetical protein